MYDFFFDFFTKTIFKDHAEIMTYSTLASLVIVISIAVKAISRLIIVEIFKALAKRTKTKWDDILLESKFFHRLSNITMPIVFNMFAGAFPRGYDFLHKIIGTVSIIVILMVVESAVNAADIIYKRYPISKTHPIKSVLQVIKLGFFIVGGIVLIAILIDENPIVLLGGIGAMTAVTGLVFKDSILGFVAGIQLSANDMIRIGDWIEMQKYSANGTVIDLTLTTVKVENFDKTITTIPAYALVSDAFINWRGMQSSGGRRIKRSIHLDASDIKICDGQMIEKFSKVYLLKDYMENKLKDVKEYNALHRFDLSIAANGRKLTNIGTFRAYVLEYLKHHPKIRKEMGIMARQLDYTPTGVPIEVYAFANTTVWSEYEEIQSDIFDHLYSIAPFFELAVFQQPSGKDFLTGLNKS